MTKHEKTMLAVCACFLLAFCATPVHSQTTDDVARLGEEIARNEELISQAKELVHETNSVKARASLQTAVHLHSESKTLFQSANYVLAGQLTKRAREAILQTIALAKREAKTEQRAARAIERATRRLEHARQLAGEHPDRQYGPARKLVDESRSQLQRAHDNMREHRYEMALGLASSSERLSTRAIGMFKRDYSDTGSIEREILKTDRVIERLSDQIDAGSDATIQRMYDDARARQQQAKENYQNGNARVAVELTEQARHVAMRALRLLASRANSENVEQAIRLTDMLLEEASELAAERNVPRLTKKVVQAGEVQQQAKNLFQGGQYREALKMTLRARNILKDALSSIKQVLNESEVQATLVETDNVLSRLRDALADSDDAVATELYVSAMSKQEKAWDSFRQGRLRAALANTKLARTLARRAMRQLNDDEI